MGRLRASKQLTIIHLICQSVINFAWRHKQPIYFLRHQLAGAQSPTMPLFNDGYSGKTIIISIYMYIYRNTLLSFSQKFMQQKSSTIWREIFFFKRSFFLVCFMYHLSRIVRKPDFCLCENKGADQLHSSTIFLLLKSEISSFWPASVLVQLGLCQTWSETPKNGFLVSRLIKYYKMIFVTISIFTLVLLVEVISSHLESKQW